jgi:hypothetical protein
MARERKGNHTREGGWRYRAGEREGEFMRERERRVVRDIEEGNITYF